MTPVRPFRSTLFALLLPTLLIGGWTDTAQAGGAERATGLTTEPSRPVTALRTLPVPLPFAPDQQSVTLRPGEVLRLPFWEDTLNDLRRWQAALSPRPGEASALRLIAAARVPRGDHGHALSQVDGAFVLRAVPGAATTETLRLTWASPEPLDAAAQAVFPPRVLHLTIRVVP
ncbi:hypothetical protein [Deinococcus arcticus]|nr:hypothetical protein [Deinococcus arcticus]